MNDPDPTISDPESFLRHYANELAFKPHAKVALVIIDESDISSGCFGMQRYERIAAFEMGKLDVYHLTE